MVSMNSRLTICPVSSFRPASYCLTPLTGSVILVTKCELDPANYETTFTVIQSTGFQSTVPVYFAEVDKPKSFSIRLRVLAVSIMVQMPRSERTSDVII